MFKRGMLRNYEKHPDTICVCPRCITVTLRDLLHCITVTLRDLSHHGNPSVSAFRECNLAVRAVSEKKKRDNDVENVLNFSQKNVYESCRRQTFEYITACLLD